MERSIHENLKLHSQVYWATIGTRNRFENRAGALERRDIAPHMADTLGIISTAVASFKAQEEALLREIKRITKGTALAEFIKHTSGLGTKVLVGVGDLPALGDEKCSTVAAAWKWAGLHVGPDGRVEKKQAGKKLGFAARRRATWLYHVAEPCTKVTGGVVEVKKGPQAGTTRIRPVSPYRIIYDRRKAHTLVTHPPMLEEGTGCEFCDLVYERTRGKRRQTKQTRERLAPVGDCAGAGGPHWTPGHRHADALRVTAKAILRDVFRVEQGLEPKLDRIITPQEYAEEYAERMLVAA